MSILSILLGFALLCGGALAALHYLGIVSLSAGEEEVKLPAGANEGLLSFPLYTKLPQAAVDVGTNGLISEKLMEEMPFTDSFYIKVKVHSDMSEGVFAQGAYEIWRYGDKYRIHRYHISDNEVEYMMICDGERVQITDFATASISYADYNAAYAFSEVAPLPNFRKLFADVHFFSLYNEDGKNCSFSCEYPLLGVMDRVEFSKDTGLVSRYRRTHDDKTLLFLEVDTSYDDYVFTDYMFSFD